MKKNIIYAVIANNNRIVSIKKINLKKAEHFTVDGKSYDIDSNNLGLYKRRPIYFYDVNNPKPKNPVSLQVGKFTPDEYNKGLNTKIISELLAVLEGKPNIDISMVLTIINLLLIIVVGIIVFLTSKDIANAIQILKLQIDSLVG